MTMYRAKVMMSKGAAVAALLVGLMVPGRADAAFTVTIRQVGNDVLATGTGSLNYTGLTRLDVGIYGASIRPSVGSFQLGSTDFVYIYHAFLSSNAGFGPEAFRDTISGSGFHVGLLASIGNLYLSQTYASGTQLTTSNTFGGTTLAAMGLTAGTYTYNYSATQGGLTLDTITIQVGPAIGVPEPASGLMCVIAGLAGVAIGSARRHVMR